MDFHGFYVDATAGGTWLLDVMSGAIKEHGMNQVHRQCVQLPLTPGASPPGFTSVCLIDESHVTAHSYSDIGWLAIDVFSCGKKADPRKAARTIRQQIEEYSPTATCVKVDGDGLVVPLSLWRV